MSKPSVLDAVKIQANVLIPVVKALEAELGAERAHAIVGDAIAKSYAEFRASRTTDRNTHPGEGAGGAPEFPIESETIEHTATAYGFDVHGCAFADWFRSIGEPGIGALMTCGVDFAVEKTLRPDWEFRRTQTRMQGADHCDFRWRLRKASPSDE
jgi:predicted hydrocarbon binding protein